MKADCITPLSRFGPWKLSGSFKIPDHMGGDAHQLFKDEMLSSVLGMIAGIAKFDERTAHLLMMAADYMIIPSRFEPCGLVAQSAARYGTIPIVTAVGGLKDFVTDEVDLQHSTLLPGHNEGAVRWSALHAMQCACSAKSASPTTSNLHCRPMRLICHLLLAYLTHTKPFHA